MKTATWIVSSLNPDNIADLLVVMLAERPDLVHLINDFPDESVAELLSTTRFR